MMADDQFRLVVHQNIRQGGLEAFKNLAEEMTRGVEADEPGTLCYEWYVSDDGSDCYLVEAYTDSDALLRHLKNVGDKLHAMMDISPLLELIVLGSPNQELRETLTGLGAKFYPRFIGCTR
jgi:quinol monooxygenase YgiN